jgi:dolichol-phosphate mannosyltransferase
VNEPTPPPDLSVVVPCHAEEAALPTLYTRLVRALADLGIDYELVLVDDGSPDKTRQVMRELRARDPRVRWIGLSRNFGHQAALTAGLARARGAHVVSMDADLQHPPELIPELLERAREGYDVVLTVREYPRSTSLFKRTASHVFYRLLSRVGELRLEPGASDFRLLSRRALDALLSLPERHRFLRGMVAWTGYRTAHVAFRAEARAAGDPSYTVRNMLRLAADALFSFSILPLRAAALSGLAVTFAAGLYAAFALHTYFFRNEAVPGWTSLLITALFLGGVQLLTLGIVGEYVARVYSEVKRRPLFVEEEREGFDGPAA